MKKIIIAIICLCSVFNAFSQTPISKNLSFMKDYKSVDLSFNFSDATIDGLKYDDYAAYYDAKNHSTGKFKSNIEPKLITNFVKGFNENGRVTTKYLTNKDDSLSKLKVTVYLDEVTKMGDTKGTVKIYEKDTNLLLATLSFKGNIDNAVTKAGKKVSGLFSKTKKPDYAKLMPLSMYDAGEDVGEKFKDAGKTVIDKIVGK